MNFAEIIRSSKQLRGTFRGIAGLEIWWRLVLALHGKPLGITNDEQAVRTLATGFRFYGRLYLALGLVFAVAGAANLLWLIIPSPYLSYMLLFTSVYLTMSSQLAFKGASLFSSEDKRGAVLLTSFFACILVFLGGFGVALGMWANSDKLVEPHTNLILFSAFILFGGGSYFIELVYLSWWLAEKTK